MKTITLTDKQVEAVMVGLAHIAGEDGHTASNIKAAIAVAKKLGFQFDTESNSFYL